MGKSNHLDEILDKHNHVSNLQVVFVDIEKYSKRRSKTQTEIIDSFTSCLKESLTKTSQHFIEYTQKNNVNFAVDIITIPTGDGAAIVFSFDGLPDIHLYFAITLLEKINELNEGSPCDKFNEHGWCNCHANFGVRIGISEEQGIIYTDINSNYNVAGNVINLASRVMGLGEKNQIIFTQRAYKQIIDMVDDPNLSDYFEEFEKVKIKHGIEETVYQYKGNGEPFIVATPPKNLIMSKRLDAALNNFSSKIGFPKSIFDEDKTANMENLIGMMEKLDNAFSTITSLSEAEIKPKVINVTQKEED